MGPLRPRHEKSQPKSLSSQPMLQSELLLEEDPVNMSITFALQQYVAFQINMASIYTLIHCVNDIFKINWIFLFLDNHGTIKR